MDYQELMPLTLNLSKSGLAAGTTTTISTGGAINYAIRGKTYTKTQITNGATPTTDAATGNAFLPVPANYGSIFMVGLNAAGSVQVVQGTVVALKSDGTFIQASQFGGVPLDFCPIGYIVIKAGSTASSSPGWLFGTNNMSGVTGITYTFVDVTSMPDRPQIQ